MNYKLVLEEQIKELQKVQEAIAKNTDGQARESCEVARTIRELVFDASRM